MKIAYLDCLSGISGDMTVSALLDAGADLAAIQSAVSSMGLSGVTTTVSQTTRKGFRGMLFSVDHPPQVVHRNLSTILGLIRRSTISTNAKDIAMRIFERLGRVEAKVHGTTLDRIHFHEIGAIDSIVDIVGAAVAWDELGIQRAYASPIPTGTGTIKIAHGMVSIPAPATAELLSNVPIAPCGLPFEMTTPTGAAIVAELVDEFGPMPSMQVCRIGYGSGQREMPDRPNLLRVLLGHKVPGRKTSQGSSSDESSESDQICVLETNLDDVSGEQIGFAIEMAWKNGALDVFTIPIQMKKNRPGVLLTVLCRREDGKRLEEILFEHTGTLGIRHRKQSRSIIPRAEIEIETPWGAVSGKVAMLPSGDVDFSPEYDDCREIASANGLRLVEVIDAAKESFAIQNKKHAPAPVSPVPVSKVPKTRTSSEPDANPAASNTTINQVFQQAAAEDEWIASSELSGEPSPPAVEAPSTLKASDHPATGQEAMYRWDSSPWD
jgi:hypothetical protein